MSPTSRSYWVHGPQLTAHLAISQKALDLDDVPRSILTCAFRVDTDHLCLLTVKAAVGAAVSLAENNSFLRSKKPVQAPRDISKSKGSAPSPSVASLPPKMRQNDDYHRVHRYLAQAGLKSQHRLPPERELSRMLGLSRARLRTILRKLVAEGMIWRRVGKGTFLGPAPADGFPHYPGAPLIDLANPRQIMEARLVLEPQLARLAAIRATRQDFLEMDLCVENLSRAPSGADWEMWDVRLHRTIAKSTENKIMLGMFDLMYARWNKDIWGNLRAIYHTAERKTAGNAEHTSFVDAIKARNPEGAYNAMRLHLQSVQQTIFRED